MSGGIYLLQREDHLVELREQAYDSEDLLQRLLAKYPNLLAGEAASGAAPRRWLLISREAGVPAEEAGPDRWAADHLFLDQEGVPTIVEVKRSTDTRLRRHVVGQMLDYAANAVAYWPVEALTSRFETRCRNGGMDPDSVLKEFLGPEGDAVQYWGATKTNLQAGKVRLVFVADLSRSNCGASWSS